MSTIRTNTLSTNSGSGTLSIPASSILNPVDYNYAIQTVSKTFYDVTSTTVTSTYVTTTNGTLAITSKLANSIFFVVMNGAGYQAGGAVSNGTNIGISRTIGGTTTRLIGTDGAGGDSWMGTGNGLATNSYSIERCFLDTPSQPAGTTITYNMLLGLWLSGTSFLNYSGYTIGSTITVMELSP
jgi:hypothetical protein